jgi:glycosyltransferase involved in cell wall biosynthesis
MSKNSVAILLPCLETGGTEVATLETALAFINAGFEVSVIVYFAEVDSLMLNNFKLAGIEVQLLGLSRNHSFMSMIIFAITLSRALRAGHRIIWVQYMTPTIVPLLIGKFFTKNLVASLHFTSNQFSNFGLRRLHFFSRYWCSRIICVSNTIAAGVFGLECSQLHNYSRVRIIPNSINFKAINSTLPFNWHEECHWNASTLVLGFVGRLAHVKGVDTLLEAISKLNRSIDVRLVIVGDGPDKDKLVELTQNLGISNHVYFYGRMPPNQVYSAIKGFDIAIIPSRDEGFGLVALEAMALGTPVIASRIGALTEVVIDNVTGLLYTAEDSKDLADKITILRNNQILMQGLRENSIKHAEIKYNRPAFQINITKLIDEL